MIKNMRVTRLTPMLYTQDIKNTQAFYIHILGFTCREYQEEAGWMLLTLDEVEIMFCPPNAHLPFDKPLCTGSFYLEVNGVDEWWEKLKDVTKVCYDINNFDYGMREFAVYDNNGYLLQFGEVINAG